METIIKLTLFNTNELFEKSLSSKLDTSNKPNPFMPGVSIILDPNADHAFLKML